MSAPLAFHRGKQLFIRAQRRQRPTWQPSDINQLIWYWELTLLSVKRTSHSVHWHKTPNYPVEIGRVSLVPVSPMRTFAVSIYFISLETQYLLDSECCSDKTSNLKMSHCALQTCDGHCFTVFWRKQINHKEGKTHFIAGDCIWPSASQIALLYLRLLLFRLTAAFPSNPARFSLGRGNLTSTVRV